MPNTKTSLENAATALDGTELVRGVQAGANVKLTVNQLAAKAKQGTVEVLTANRDYYVRTDGNNSNDGLSDTSGGALLTVQAAVTKASLLVVGAYHVVIHVGTGTFTGAVNCGALSKSSTGSTEAYRIVGASRGTTTIVGRVGVSNAYISLISINIVGGVYVEKGYVYTEDAQANSFGAGSGGEVYVGYTSYLSGNAYFGLYAFSGGVITVDNMEFVGNPSYSGAAVSADGAGFIFFYSTPGGTCVGKRFKVAVNSFIQTYGAGVNGIPGTIAGTADNSTGGYYL